MYRDIESKHIISANIEYYTNLWSTVLFWGSIPVVFLSQDMGENMMLSAFVLLAIRMLNRRVSVGKWFR